jgi:hypothetical protein
MAGREFCPHCFHNLWGGGRCKRRACPSYASIYLRDQAEVIKANLAVWDGHVCMVTLTAPGRDVLPWDRRRCSHPGRHKCSGRLGCRVDETAAAVWNADVARRLSALMNRCQQRVRDRHGKGVHVVLLCYVLEAQRRGVLHPHLVLGYRTAKERKALDTLRKGLRELRGEYGFGTGSGSFDEGQPERFNPADAARYISKYLRPDSAKASFVPLLSSLERLVPYRRDPETGEVLMSPSKAKESMERPARVQLRPVYTNRKLTTISEITIGFLRYKRRHWCEHGGRPLTEVLGDYRTWKVPERDAVPWDVRQEIEQHFRRGWAPVDDEPPSRYSSVQEAWPF